MIGFNVKYNLSTFYDYWYVLRFLILLAFARIFFYYSPLYSIFFMAPCSSSSPGRTMALFELEDKNELARIKAPPM